MINESIAHLIHPDGTKIQVLKDVIATNEDGSLSVTQDWDEVATHAAYAAYVASKE